MPGFDGNGPFGTGPVGRGLGPCGGGLAGRGARRGMRGGVLAGSVLIPRLLQKKKKVI